MHTHAQLIARKLRELYFGKNWTAVNIKDSLSDISWEEVNIQIDNSNSILALVYHIYYYSKVTLPVLKGEPLTANDKYAFDHPTITNQKEWEDFIQETYKLIEAFAHEIEKLDDTKLFTPMDDPKWGTYFKNINGVVEHGYYHLGQIVLLKKLIRARK